MPRRIQLAAEESEGLLTAHAFIIDDFICRALRGEPESWAWLPAAVGTEQVLSCCRHHGVASLLHHALNETVGAADWPQEFRDSLEAISRAQAAQEMLRGHYLGELLARFADYGVRCLVVKGEALARTHYRTPGTRTRGDSDLFIRISDIGTAVKAVQACGFEIVSSTYKNHQFAVRGTGSASDAFEIDVHWRILNAPRFARRISFEEAYQRSVGLPGLEPARTLDAADALLLQCMHRSGSDWHDHNRLIWLYDLHLLLSGMELRQSLEFAERAVRLNVQEHCLDGLVEAQNRFGTRMPGEVEIVLRTPGNARTLSRRFAEGYAGLLVDDLKALGDWRARRSLLAELVVPDRQFLLRKYGKTDRAWLPGLYLRHIVGGITRHLTPW